MASLAAALVERQKVAALERAERAQRVRLVADPLVTVQDLQRVLGHYLDFKKCSDLWSLISPPPGGPISVTWQTPVNGSWLSKVAGLLYDLVGLAPNTKLLSSKVVKALRVLLERKQLELRPRQGSTQDILDRIDLTLRILLTMVRTLKTSPSTKTKVYRSLSIQEQQEVDMILEKVCLPAEFVSQGFDPEEGDQHVKV